LAGKLDFFAKVKFHRKDDYINKEGVEY